MTKLNLIFARVHVNAIEHTHLMMVEYVTALNVASIVHQSAVARRPQQRECFVICVRPLISGYYVYNKPP